MIGARSRWSLTTPVARPAILVAKWAAGVVALGTGSIFVPLVLQAVIATIAYGALPDLPLIAGFGVPYLLVPAFWVALAIMLGSVLTSTAGVAGIGLLVLFLPSVIGAFAPTIAEISPTAAPSGRTRGSPAGRCGGSSPSSPSPR